MPRTPSNRIRVALLGVMLLLGGSLVSAQSQAPQTNEPKELSLETKDGVVLKATFYPGQKGKESIPVMLLHEFKKSRRDMESLASYLQKTHGCAVIAPDLRGHGDSTTQKSKDGTSKKLDAESLKTMQFQEMVLQDLEAVKKHLLEENNGGRLNIDKLSIVGVQMGASVGMLWAARDWSWPALVTGKQGQDVKALVLITPEEDFKGLRMASIRNAPPPQVKEFTQTASLYIAVGAGLRPEMAKSQRIFNMFNQGRKPPKEDIDRTMFLDPMETSLHGTALLTEPSLKLAERIGAFFELRSGATSGPWQNRANPLSP